MDTRGHQIDVVESYIKYRPPCAAEAAVQDLLKCLPAKYLTGLDCVVLTNASGQPRRERRQRVRCRGRKIHTVRARGLYFPPWNGRKPHVVLYVDHILNTKESSQHWRPLRPGWLVRVIRRFCTCLLFARVLYHEVGHHVHLTQRPEHRERENVAEAYAGRFMRRFFVRRMHLVAFAVAAAFLIRPVRERVFFLIRLAIMASIIRRQRHRMRRAFQPGMRAA